MKEKLAELTPLERQEIKTAMKASSKKPTW